jgi:glycosyltransferase involved in cell wall biosynthesis
MIKKILFYATYPTQSNGYARIGNILSNYLAEDENLEVYYFGISNFDIKIRRFIHPKIKLIDVVNEEKKIDSKEIYGTDIINNFIELIKPDILFLYNDLIVISRLFNEINKINYNCKKYVYLDLVYDFEKYELIKFIEKNCDLLFVFSNFWKQNLIEMGVNRDKIHILSHGFDNQTFFEIDKIAAKKFFGFNKDDFIILNSNRNSYRKCLDITIFAFLRFLKFYNFDERIKLFLNCIFEHNEGYDIYNLVKIECLRLEIDYNLIINKHIFKLPQSGYVDDNVINILYNACDVGINTCGGEGFGLCNLEHGGLGKVQIVSKVGGLTDIFKKFELMMIKPKISNYIANSIDWHGGIFHICDPDDFATVLSFYFSYHEKLEHDGKLLQDHIIKNYNWKEILIQFKSFFLEFL